MHSAVKSPIHLPFGVTSHAAVLNEPIVAKGDIETVGIELARYFSSALQL